MTHRSALLLPLALVALTHCRNAPSPSPARLATIAPAAVITSSPGPATIDAAVPVTDASWSSDAGARAEPTPLDREVALGTAVFFRACGGCHLGMWRVPSGGFLSRTNWTEAAVRRQIRRGGAERDGRARMPAISTEHLPESEMPALMAYLRTTGVVAPR